MSETSAAGDRHGASSPAASTGPVGLPGGWARDLLGTDRMVGQVGAVHNEDAVRAAGQKHSADGAARGHVVCRRFGLTATGAMLGVRQ